MKTAKEMFERSGYQVQKDDEGLLVYERNDIYVVFEKKNKVYHAFESHNGYRLVVYSTISTHELIHQQMKELGWIDE